MKSMRVVVLVVLALAALLAAVSLRGEVIAGGSQEYSCLEGQSLVDARTGSATAVLACVPETPAPPPIAVRICEKPEDAPCYLPYSREEIAEANLSQYLKESALIDSNPGLGVFFRSVGPGMLEVSWYRLISR